tara:strand:+ start:48 stop:524 length:477 start_codon:yes stop_codon:yes gene_type:complete
MYDIIITLSTMDSYGNSRAGSSKGHRSQRRNRTKGAKPRQQLKKDKEFIVKKDKHTKREITAEQVYWKKRHAKEILRERTYKQSLQILQNDTQPEKKTNQHASLAFVAWENHIKNIEFENNFRSWENHIKVLERENKRRTQKHSHTNHGKKRKFSEIC